jgi:hypothetical protein
MTQALRMAHAANDRAFGGRILAAMSHQALHLGDVRHGLDFACAARAGTQRTFTATTAAMLAAMEACAHAARGDASPCLRALTDEVDELYLDVERRILGLFALQTPVASDLRLLTALLHINLHLERIADQAVNMAKIASSPTACPISSRCCSTLRRWARSRLGWWGRRWLRWRAAIWSSRMSCPGWTIRSTG